MGTPKPPPPEESDGACYAYAQGLPDRVRRRREVMINALAAAGMVNYPTE